MKSTIPVLLLMLVASLLMGQGALNAQNRCSHILPPEYAKHLNATREARQQFDLASMRGTVRWIPVSFHVVTATNGSIGNIANDFPSVLNRLNVAFGPANVAFYACGRHEVIRNSLYINVNMLSDLDPLVNTHDVPNTLNLYFFPNLAQNVGFYLGGTEHVYFKSAFINSPGLVEHEVGHYFGLYHTHGDDSPNSIPECPNGSNCATAGDEVCDTPADPNILTLMSGCTYIGTVQSPCGGSYTPAVNNYMNYAPLSCQSTFTAGQFNRIAYSAFVDHANLACPNSAYQPCSTIVTTFPHAQSFESGTIDNGWVNSTFDNFDWSVDNGQAPHYPSTGPAGAASGNYFAYIEAQGNNPNKVAVLESPCFDLTKTISPELTFSYHMSGSHTGSLRLEMSTNGGSTWSQLLYKKGSQGSNWITPAAIDLSQYVSQTFVRFRFTATSSLGDFGDIAIDNFSIASSPCPFSNSSFQFLHVDLVCSYQHNGQVRFFPPNGLPVGTTYAWANGNNPSTVISTNSFMGGLSPGPYQVTVTYNGCSDAYGAYVEDSHLRITTEATHPTVMSPTGSITVTMEDGTLPYVSLSWTGPVSGTVAVPTSPYTIPNLPSGLYEITMQDGAGCVAGSSVEILSNLDCHCTGSIGVGSVESFESGWGDWSYCEGQNEFFPFARSTGDVAPIGSAGPTTSTAPNAPNGAYDGNYYVHSNSVSQNGFQYGSMLMSPCLNFTGVSNPGVRFNFHSFESSGANAQLYAYLFDPNSGIPPIQVYSNQGGPTGDYWQQATADLSIAGNTNGQYQILFFALGAGNPIGEIAIDKVELIDCSTAGFTASISTNGPSCLSTASATVTASCSGGTPTYQWSTGATTATATGLTIYTMYTVTVTCPGAACERVLYTYPLPNAMITSTYTTDVLWAGQNNGAVDLVVSGGRPGFTYSWTGPNGFTATTQDLSNLAPGTYDVTVTDAAGCTKTAQGIVKDGSCPNLVDASTYNESWEADFGKWKNVTGEATQHMDWTRHSGASAGTQSGPSSAVDGTYYVYMNSNGATAGAEAHLISHCIDLRRSTAASFTFNYHAKNTAGPSSNMGDLYLDITTNQGNTWTTLATIVLVSTSANQWYTSTPVSLNAYVGKVVQLRFRGVMGVSNRSDIALDHPLITGTFFKSDPAEAAGLFGGLTLYPNPSLGQVNVDFIADRSKSVHCRITDVAGKVLRSWETETQPGDNHLDFSTQDLGAGTYFLEMEASPWRIVKRFVVMK